MSYTIGQLVDELMELLNDDASDITADDHLMLNVAGRWTGIQGITLPQPALILIESED